MLGYEYGAWKGLCKNQYLIARKANLEKLTSKEVGEDAQDKDSYEELEGTDEGGRTP